MLHPLIAKVEAIKGNVEFVEGGIKLFMAMISAIQCNPVFKMKYQQLLAQGKPKKLAIIACVRKMIIILNSMLQEGVKWELDCAK